MPTRPIRCPAVRPLVAALLALAPLAAGAQTIDTRNADPVVITASRPFGQTFVAPAGAPLLQRFSFFVTLGGDGATSYVGRVMAWDAAGPVGPLLYESDLRVPGCCTVLETSFLTGGIALTPGATYVAFLVPLTGSLAHELPGDPLVGFADTYADGGAATAACPTGLASCTWSADSWDRAFVAQFSAAPLVTPEPGALLLVATGFIGVAGTARAAGRRRLAGRGVSGGAS